MTQKNKIQDKRYKIQDTSKNREPVSSLQSAVKPEQEAENQFIRGKLYLDGARNKIQEYK